MTTARQSLSRRASLLTAAAVALVAGAFAAPAHAQDVRFIQIGTGTTGGTFYPAGIALANLIGDNLEVRASAISSAGSVENVDLLRNEEANMAFVQINVAQDAVAGRNKFEGSGFDGMSLLTPLFRSADHVVVTNDSDIESLEDLEGKRVGVGRAGSGTLLTSEALLGSVGLTMDDITPDYIGQGEALDALKNGMIDAAPISGGTPIGALTEALTVAGDRLTILELSEEEQQGFVESSGWKVPHTIEAGVYPEQDEPITTTAHMAMLMVPNDLPEELGLQILELMYGSLDELQNAHGVYKSVSKEGSADAVSRLDLPLHPAAEQFFGS